MNLSQRGTDWSTCSLDPNRRFFILASDSASCTAMWFGCPDIPYPSNVMIPPNFDFEDSAQEVGENEIGYMDRIQGMRLTCGVSWESEALDGDWLIRSSFITILDVSQYVIGSPSVVRAILQLLVIYD